MAHYAVHTPIMADERFVETYLEKGLDSIEAKYASMVEGMDKSLGDIMDYLELKGLEENTIVIFISDNGGLSAHTRGGEPYTHNRPLNSGSKGSFYEGGIRVPLLVKWPGITERASRTDHQVIVEDLYPTLLEIAQVQAVDGESFVDVLTKKYDSPGVRLLFWHYPKQWGPEGPGIGAASVVRRRDWKLVYFHVDQRMELFNLKGDIGETQNLEEEEGEKVQELAQVLTQHLKTVKAQMPSNKKAGKRVVYPN